MTAPDDEFETWSQREDLAEQMVPLIGSLYRRLGVVASIYGRSLVGESTLGILKAHRFARHVHGEELDPAEVLPVLQVLIDLPLQPASIDLGRIVDGYSGSLTSEEDLQAYLRDVLAPALTAESMHPREPTDVVLYGFGRIGRLVARILIEHRGDGNNLRLRAIVVRPGAADDLAKRASLLRRDSVHGPFSGTITVDEADSTIIANGTRIRVIYASDPSTVDYTAYGIRDAIVVDNTGRWRDEETLSRHLDSAGAARVLLTAPGRGAIKNIVHGINHDGISAQDLILAAASCTTNAVTPVLKALHDEYGVTRGHIETVHSFTNDQNLTDNFHRGDRRGRAATSNMVITETGAARAVTKALPQLAGRLTGNAIRVPTPDVSLAVLNLTLEHPVDKGALNAYLRSMSLDSHLQKQIDYIESREVVSSDFLGSHRAGVVDGLATIADGSSSVVLYVWYDNEAGYSSQVVRVLETLAGGHPPTLPVRGLRDSTDDVNSPLNPADATASF